MKRMSDRTRRFSRSKQYLNSITVSSIQKHDKALELYRTLEILPNEAIRVFWNCVFSFNLISTNKNGTVGRLRLPSFQKQSFCLTTWLHVMGISNKKFQRLRPTVEIF